MYPPVFSLSLHLGKKLICTVAMCVWGYMRDMSDNVHVGEGEWLNEWMNYTDGPFVSLCFKFTACLKKKKSPFRKANLTHVSAALLHQRWKLIWALKSPPLPPSWHFCLCLTNDHNEMQTCKLPVEEMELPLRSKWHRQRNCQMVKWNWAEIRACNL